MNDSLNCNELRALLVLFVGEDLDAAESARVARHLSECGPCRAEQARWMETRSRLATLRETTGNSGPSVWSNVRAGLMREGRIAPARTQAPRRRSWAPLAVAAAAVVAIGLFALYQRTDAPPVGAPGDNVAEPTPVTPPGPNPEGSLVPEVQLANAPLRKAGAGDEALIYSAEPIDKPLMRLRHGAKNNPALNLAGDEQIR